MLKAEEERTVFQVRGAKGSSERGEDRGKAADVECAGEKAVSIVIIRKSKGTTHFFGAFMSAGFWVLGMPLPECEGPIGGEVGPERLPIREPPIGDGLAGFCEKPWKSGWANVGWGRSRSLP